MVEKTIKRMLFPFVVTIRFFYAGLKQYRGHCGHGCALVHVVKSMVNVMPMCSCVAPVIMPGSFKPFSSSTMPTA